MITPIDYSRPVGWWCDVCGWESLSSVRDKCHCKSPVASLFWGPVFLPIPEGQRPPAASEVEEAEVVTGWQWGAWWIRPNPQTDSGWHTQITDALIDEITGATE